jgi:phthalate 4,5-dioxygenase
VGPDTVDGIAPAGEWATWWREQVRNKREGAPWMKNPHPSPLPQAGEEAGMPVRG